MTSSYYSPLEETPVIHTFSDSFVLVPEPKEVITSSNNSTCYTCGFGFTGQPAAYVKGSTSRYTDTEGRVHESTINLCVWCDAQYRSRR